MNLKPVEKAEPVALTIEGENAERLLSLAADLGDPPVVVVNAALRLYELLRDECSKPSTRVVIRKSNGSERSLHVGRDIVTFPSRPRK